MLRDGLLWLLTLTGPLLWFASQCVSFAVAPWNCASERLAAVYAVPVVAVLGTVAAALAAWTQWRELGAQAPENAGGTQASRRAMASAGMMLNCLFVLVILAQLVAPAILEVCP